MHGLKNRQTVLASPVYKLTEAAALRQLAIFSSTSAAACHQDGKAIFPILRDRIEGGLPGQSQR